MVHEAVRWRASRIIRVPSAAIYDTGSYKWKRNLADKYVAEYSRGPIITTGLDACAADAATPISDVKARTENYVATAKAKSASKLHT